MDKYSLFIWTSFGLTFLILYLTGYSASRTLASTRQILKTEIKRESNGN